MLFSNHVKIILQFIFTHLYLFSKKKEKKRAWRWIQWICMCVDVYCEHWVPGTEFYRCSLTENCKNDQFSSRSHIWTEFLKSWFCKAFFSICKVETLAFCFCDCRCLYRKGAEARWTCCPNYTGISTSKSIWSSNMVNRPWPITHGKAHMLPLLE